MLTVVTNIFLVIPGLPLLVVVAAFLPRSTWSVIFVLAVARSGPARVIRAQALSVVKRDYVASATVIGERPVRIIAAEVLPNLSSLIATVLFGAVGYGIGSLAALQFLGLGDLTTASWGTILYSAQSNSSLLQGTWWQFVPAGSMPGSGLRSRLDAQLRHRRGHQPAAAHRQGEDDSVGARCPPRS